MGDQCDIVSLEKNGLESMINKGRHFLKSKIFLIFRYFPKIINFNQKGVKNEQFCV